MNARAVRERRKDGHAEDDMCRNGVITGTNRGEFNGAKPTNKTIGIRGAKDLSGKASAKQFFGMFTKAFPDAKFSSSALFGVHDVVVSESSITATHAGPLGPLKPTNKPVTMHGLDIMVVKDGKVVSIASYSNSFELLDHEGDKPAADTK